MKTIQTICLPGERGDEKVVEREKNQLFRSEDTSSRGKSNTPDDERSDPSSDSLVAESAQCPILRVSTLTAMLNVNEFAEARCSGPGMASSITESSMLR